MKADTIKDRIIILVLTAAAVVLATILVLLPQNALAADRSAEGAVVMPDKCELAVEQGVSTKVNFGSDYDGSKYYYFIIKPTKTGYISFTCDYVNGKDIALCNSEKKMISRASKSSDDFYNTNSDKACDKILCYGVKKGVTYLIRVKGTSAYMDDSGQVFIGTVKWTNTAVKNTKYGKTRKGALKIKMNAVKNGVVKAGSRNAQWFKITTTKKTIKISFSAKNNCGTIYARVYFKSSGKWRSGRMFAMRRSTKYKVPYKDSITLKKTSKKKITYYIKVYPDYRSSGAYKLKWR